MGRPPRRCRTTWSAPTRPASCCASARRCATGSPATGSRCTATTSTIRIRRAHDDSMLATNQRIWGFETNFGGLADLAVVKANQLMPKPTHLTWEEAAVNALCNSTTLPDARGAQRRADEAGRRRADLGRHRRHRRVRDAVRAQRRRHPGRRRQLAGQGRAAERDGRARRSSTARPRTTGSGRTSTPRTRASGGGSASTSASWSATTPTSCSSTPAAQTLGASIFACKRGGTVVTCAATAGYMVEFDNRHFWMRLKRLIALALRQLRGGVGSEPADRQGQDPAAAVSGVPARRDGEAALRSTATSTRARSACCAWPRPKGSASTTPRSASAIGEDKITLFRRSLTR